MGAGELLLRNVLPSSSDSTTVVHCDRRGTGGMETLWLLYGELAECGQEN